MTPSGINTNREYLETTLRPDQRYHDRIRNVDLPSEKTDTALEPISSDSSEHSYLPAQEFYHEKPLAFTHVAVHLAHPYQQAIRALGWTGRTGLSEIWKLDSDLPRHLSFGESCALLAQPSTHINTHQEHNIKSSSSPPGSGG